MDTPYRDVATVVGTKKCYLAVGNVNYGKRICVELIILGQTVRIAFGLRSDALRGNIFTCFFGLQNTYSFSIDKQ